MFTSGSFITVKWIPKVLWFESHEMVWGVAYTVSAGPTSRHLLLDFPLVIRYIHMKHARKWIQLRKFPSHLWRPVPLFISVLYNKNWRYRALREEQFHTGVSYFKDTSVIEQAQEQTALVKESAIYTSYSCRSRRPSYFKARVLS